MIQAWPLPMENLEWQCLLQRLPHPLQYMAGQTRAVCSIWFLRTALKTSLTKISPCQVAVAAVKGYYKQRQSAHHITVSFSTNSMRLQTTSNNTEVSHTQFYRRGEREKSREQQHLFYLHCWKQRNWSASRKGEIKPVSEAECSWDVLENMCHYVAVGIQTVRTSEK